MQTTALRTLTKATGEYGPRHYSDGTAEIWLQDIGFVSAIPAAELRPGMTVVYNFGGTATVDSVAPVSAKFLTLTVNSNGKLYSRRVMATKLVAVKQSATRGN